MTGEVSWIKPNGEDSRGDVYETHAAVAKALRCQLRPFDAYIGPYVATKAGKLFLGDDEGGGAYVCLWPGGVAPAYREPIVEHFWNPQDVAAAITAARAAIAKARGEA